ncbi:MAG TPA: M23 family metallopeptidase [Hyphomicrobiales bacterium]|nr:M23 family metallopeptidase [Hyphomicrobiales bacterium]
MSAQRSRIAHRSAAVELGDEPPLRVGGAAPTTGPVNLRWLGGTILTALAGIGLLGAAIGAAMNGEALLAKAPGFAQPRLARLVGDRISNALRKSDRISPTDGVKESRQIFRLSTTSEVGDHEVVRTRPVTLVSASLTTGDVSAYKIPPFNPMSLFADDGARASDPGPEPDGDISYVTRDLASVAIAPEEGPYLPLSEVVARVREAAAFDALHKMDLGSAVTGDRSALPSATSRPAESKSATTVAAGGPLSNMTVLIKSPDATAAPQSATAADRAAAAGEKSVTAAAGDALDKLLVAHGVATDQAAAIAGALPPQSNARKLAAGTNIRILFAPHPGDPSRQDAVRVTLAAGSDETSVVQSDTGGYVAVAGQVQIVEDASQEGDESAAAAAEDEGKTPRLYDSLYATALAKGVPVPVIRELIHIFGYDADFERRIADGDGFEVLYASTEDGKAAGDHPEVLYASLLIDGDTKRFYRFETPGGSADYFDEDGRSTRKFLVRKPVPTARFSRGFGMLRHPILGYTRAHTGVDWAAPRGTPIGAAGDGVIEYDKWENGYGRQIRIRHANGYETTYGHMSAFARGIEPGVHVRQGQIIGYVGSTGLSTGPHVHFEVIVNGRFVDPMRIKVPRGQELAGTALAAFEKERRRLDNYALHGASPAELIRQPVPGTPVAEADHRG